jgi:hypothetical protein
VHRQRGVQPQGIGQRRRYLGGDAGVVQLRSVGIARLQATVHPQPHRRFLRTAGEDRLGLCGPVVADALRQPSGPRGLAASLRQALALRATQHGIDQAGLVRAPQRARRIHAGRHRGMRGQADFQLGEAGEQQRAQFVVAGLERLGHPLRERCIETRALAQRAHHDGLHQRAVARILQRGQGRRQRRLQRATTVQDHVEHARRTDPGIDPGAHAAGLRRALR